MTGSLGVLGTGSEPAPIPGDPGDVLWLSGARLRSLTEGPGLPPESNDWTHALASTAGEHAGTRTPGARRCGCRRGPSGGGRAEATVSSLFPRVLVLTGRTPLGPSRLAAGSLQKALLTPPHRGLESPIPGATCSRVSPPASWREEPLAHPRRRPCWEVTQRPGRLPFEDLL